VQQDVAQLARYTVEMGGTFALLEVALKVPPWEPMHQLSRAELRAMNMATIDNWPSDPAVSLAPPATPATSSAVLGPADAADHIDVRRSAQQRSRRSNFR
jgi:hypothetical protein